MAQQPLVRQRLQHAEAEGGAAHAATGQRQPDHPGLVGAGGKVGAGGGVRVRVQQLEFVAEHVLEGRAADFVQALHGRVVEHAASGDALAPAEFDDGLGQLAQRAGMGRRAAAGRFQFAAQVGDLRRDQAGWVERGHGHSS